ncbi:MAG: hypothetical protein H7X94_10315 [Vallitaleaceae bacterium]|nr:hypothetical protein [Vallitaleaceae bacterium]
MQNKLKIVDIVNEAKGTKTYYFNKPEDFTWEAGAHTHLGHLGFDEGERPNKNWVRHMSIMTLPSENRIGITTRVPGSSSEFKIKLSELIVGDEIIQFKLGSRMSLRRNNRPIVLLSMGVGMATMRPLILNFANHPDNIPRLVNVNVDASGEHIFKDEIDPLSSENLTNYWLNSRQTFYEALEQMMKLEQALYYIVGSDVFIKDIIARLMANNVNREDIVIDKKEEVMDQFFELEDHL